jgi:phosphoserine phosphatase RsbU/P
MAKKNVQIIRGANWLVPLAFLDSVRILVVDVSQDWMLACDVQRHFMQGLGRTSDSVDYSARCRQFQALGGDCYDFMPLTNDRLALVVGDASGKGVAAAPMITSVQSSLRTACSIFVPWP